MIEHMDTLIGALAGIAAAPLALAGVGRCSRRPWSRGRVDTVAVVVACAAAGAWAAGWADGPQVPAAWWVLLVAGVPLAVLDVREHRLPDLLVTAAAVGVLAALTAASVLSGEWQPWWRAIAVAAAAFALMYVMAVVTDLGYGDVKLIARDRWLRRVRLLRRRDVRGPGWFPDRLDRRSGAVDRHSTGQSGAGGGSVASPRCRSRPRRCQLVKSGAVQRNRRGRDRGHVALNCGTAVAARAGPPRSTSGELDSKDHPAELRGARTIEPNDFQAVTPDARSKDRFVIVDAVGVTEHDYVDAAPLERAKTVPLKRLLDKAAALTLTEDETATLASRLAKLELDLTSEERRELDDVAGQPVRGIIQGLVAAVDPDEQAKVLADDPGGVQRLLDEALRPIAANPALRIRIVELRAKHDQVIDEVSVDQLLDARGQVDRGKASSVVESWKQYLDDHRDEITALQLMYAGGGSGRTSYAELRELAERIKRPPHNWTPDLLWKAYEVLDVDRVAHADRHTVTDLVSLVRYTLGADERLVPYASKVEERYAAWLIQQGQAGAVFSERQRWWLDRIADVIATSVGIAVDDLDNAPFAERGGVDGALRDLADEVETYLDQLNRQLPA